MQLKILALHHQTLYKEKMIIVLISIQPHCDDTSFHGSHTDVTVPAINDLDML